jgi:hypothetical protein
MHTGAGAGESASAGENPSFDVPVSPLLTTIDYWPGDYPHVPFLQDNV